MYQLEQDRNFRSASDLRCGPIGVGQGGNTGGRTGGITQLGVVAWVALGCALMLVCDSQEKGFQQPADATRRATEQEFSADVRIEINVLAARERQDREDDAWRLQQQEAFDAELGSSTNVEMNRALAVGLAEEAQLAEQQRVRDLMKQYAPALHPTGALSATDAIGRTSVIGNESNVGRTWTVIP